MATRKEQEYINKLYLKCINDPLRNIAICFMTPERIDRLLKEIVHATDMQHTSKVMLLNSISEIYHMDSLLYSLIELDRINELKLVLTQEMISEFTEELMLGIIIYPQSRKTIEFLNKELTFKKRFIRYIKKALNIKERENNNEH